jgi:hypothetical protein
MNVTVLFPHDPITFSNLFGNVFDIIRRHVVIHEDELERIVTSFRSGATREQVRSVIRACSNIFVRNPQGFLQIHERLCPDDFADTLRRL